MARKAKIVVVFVLLGLCSSAPAIDGSGTQTDPYIITNVDELQAMRDNLSAHYQLGNDIDAAGTPSWNSGAGFEPVGSAATPFTGTLDGREHTITGLYINRPSVSGVALFGRTWGAQIKDVGLVDAQIYGNYSAATLVGSNQGRSTVTSCYATGEVIISASGSNDTKSGGLVGSNGTSLISQCYSAVNVTALSSRYQLGGLCGYSRARSGDDPALVVNCYSTGTVTSNGWKVGGLLGDADGENSTVSKCYSVARVSGSRRKGLVGYNWRSPTIVNSYWDTQTSTCSSSYGGAGRSTAQMMRQATFVNWDFDEVWDIIENQTYPFFKEPAVLLSLEITGPDEVAENHQTQYSAIAHYDNNSTRDVTDLAVWSVEPNTLAAIDQSGLLTTQPTNYLAEDITIYAQYTEDNNTVDPEKPVSIFAVCPTGSALHFDGSNDYVLAAGDASLPYGSTARTVAMWLYTNASAWARNADTPLHYGLGSTRRAFGLDMDYYPNMQFYTWDDDLYFDAGVPLEGWVHVAIVYDGATGMQAYSQGELRGSKTLAAPLDTAFTDIEIGTYLGLGYFNDRIDEVAIYNRVLTSEEIQVLMHTRPDADEPNLVAYWNFDEGEGQIIYDLSPYANHGRLGSDPNADDSDPAWVDSDAPVGICTTKGLVERNLSQVFGMKETILEILEDAIATEDATKEFLDELFKSGEIGDLKKGDVVKAKQKIMGAIQQEEQAETAVGQSIDKLDDALNTLGIE